MKALMMITVLIACLASGACHRSLVQVPPGEISVPVSSHPFTMETSLVPTPCAVLPVAGCLCRHWASAQESGIDSFNLISLWSVEDEATRQWMIALYRGRLLKGLGTAEAVREAGLAVLRGRREKS